VDHGRARLAFAALGEHALAEIGDLLDARRRHEKLPGFAVETTP
jgi:hypothetical protein